MGKYSIFRSANGEISFQLRDFCAPRELRKERESVPALEPQPAIANTLISSIKQLQNILVSMVFGYSPYSLMAPSRPTIERRTYVVPYRCGRMPRHAVADHAVVSRRKASVIMAPRAVRRGVRSKVGKSDGIPATSMASRLCFVVTAHAVVLPMAH